MTESTTAQRQAVHEALTTFAHKPLGQAATDLLAALGYSSQKTADLGHTAEELLGNIEQFRPDLGNIDRSKLQAAHWNSCAFLFQLTNDEIPSLAIGQSPLGADKQITPSQIESFVFLAIELQGESWTRTQLAAITRGLNQRFPMPAIVLFRYADCLSVAVIDRRQHLHDASREVLDSRITVIKDVRLTQPHRAHIDILARLILQNLGNKCCPSNFRELYDGWIGTLSTQKLNETFYKELAWWYMWAVKEVDFPQGGGEKVEERNAIGVIRLLTRLIFVWFIKERGLVPQALFDRDVLRTLLKQAPDNAPDASNYYQAILQNLFFATLNTEMGEQRRWAKTGKGRKEDYLIGLVYRYPEAFVQPDTVLQDYFANIPFLNGGLFEYLDEQLTEQDLARRPELRPLVVKEGSQWVLRVDGFSSRPEARAKVPNKLFFDGVADAELNTEFDTKGKRYPVCGLIDLLNRYKFTVDENTPLDEEVALDPELLGKVFENLLASYNPDTRTTARKQSGSFYTPREVVDYMVNEALIAYFARHLPQGEQREAELRQLLSHADIDHSFNTTEADALVAAIENLKVLDPACGSGAFPMGMLAKLVATLKKIDPHNRRWCEQNRASLQQRLAALVRKTPDPLQRDTEIDEAEAALHKHSQDFANPAYADYTRKLYLIEKCIFGSDIQPIAVQIAKLRFFIALIVSQPIDRTKPNWGITPLPNLETKIVAANTLFGVPRQGIQMSLINDPMISEKESELREANAAYFSARTRASKKRRKEKVQKLHEELVNLLQRDHFVTAQDAERMARWNPFDQNRSADFFDVEWMFGMPRASDSTEAVFDIVIGNPPYVRHEEIKELKPLLKDIYHYECYTGTADLFVYFYERSIKLLKPQGVLSFITSNKWYRAKYGENLRQFMATHTVLKNIIDFGDEGIFTAIAYPTIVIAVRREDEKMPLSDKEVIRVLNWNKIYQVEYFPAVFQKELFKMPQIELKKQGWQLEPPKEREILARIRLVGTPLSDYVNGRFYRGVLTGLNEAFVIDADTKQQLITEDARSAEIIKPFLRGRDIKRWSIEFENQFLIKIESSENVLHPWSNKSLEDAEEIFFNHYPAIYKRFQKYKKAMIDRCDQGKYFWELRSCAYWNEFELTKIIYPDIAKSPQFTWDSGGSFLANTAYMITGVEEWLLAILNSSIISWFYSQISPQIQNGYFRFIAQYVGQLPIPSISSELKISLGCVVSSVFAISDSRFEQLLNGLVFELFFPQDLHAAKIYLFDACEQAGIDQLAGLQGKVLQAAAQTWVDTVFATGHPIYAMLFDLQALDVVRTIEGKA